MSADHRSIFGSGEVGSILATVPWQEHPLGELASWSPILRTAVMMCLASPAPMQLWWGSSLTLIYNDAAIPQLAAHPGALGRPAPEAWGERFSSVRTHVDRVFAEGVPVTTNGTTLTPLHDIDGGVAGVVCTTASDAKDDFLAVVGHELRNPLSTVAVMVQALLLRSPSQEVELMDRAVRHLTGVVERLLERSLGSRGTIAVTDTITGANDGEGTDCDIPLSGAAPPAREPIAARTRHKRLLLVEDNDDAARALKAALEQLGYEVALAHDGPVAINLAKNFAPDVALLDLGLPVMDGWELARRLRTAASELPIVAVTARDQEADKHRSAELGFAEHLVKPIDLARLEQIVEALSSRTSSDVAR